MVADPSAMRFFLAYDGVLVLYNKTGCEASQLSKRKSRDITESCNITESCYVRKELYKREKIGGDRGEQNKSLSRFKRGFKISFKVFLCIIRLGDSTVLGQENTQNMRAYYTVLHRF